MCASIYSTGGLKIKDDEFTQFGSLYTAYLNTHVDVFNKVIKCLDNVLETGIMSGAVHDSLKDFKVNAEELCSTLNENKDLLSNYITSYLSKINEAQKFNGFQLYEEGYPCCKDFSSSYFTELEDFTDKNANDTRDHFENIITFIKPVLKFLKIYNKEYESAEAEKISDMMEIYDISEAALYRIKGQLEDVDKEYKSKIDEFNSLMDRYMNTLEVLYRAVDSYKTIPTSFHYDSYEFSTWFEELKRSLKRIKEDDITYEEIDAFIAQLKGNASNLFSKDNLIIEDFINSLKVKYAPGSKDYLGLLAIQAYDAGKANLLDKDGYEKLLMKKKILEIINESAKTKDIYKESDTHNSLEVFNFMTEQFGENGQRFYDVLNNLRKENGRLVLDGRTVEAKSFRNFIKEMEISGDISEYTDKGLQVLAYLVADYTTQKEYLASIMRNIDLPPNSDLSDVMSEIENDFNKNYKANIRAYGNELFKESFSALQKIFGNPISWVESSINVIDDLTGIKTKSQETYNLIVNYTPMIDSAKSSFVNSYNVYTKFLSDHPKTCPPYSLREDLENTFAYYKNTLVSAYETMISSATGDEREQFIKRAGALEKATIDNCSAFIS